MAEAGAPDFELTSWNGLFTPTGTPPEIVRRVNASFAQVAQIGAIRKVFTEQASEVVASTPEAFRSFVEAEIKRWGDAIAAANISI
jgi:tripartite-type tricarboxylate transporter receptor subunit TctC